MRVGRLVAGLRALAHGAYAGFEVCAAETALLDEGKTGHGPFRVAAGWQGWTYRLCCGAVASDRWMAVGWPGGRF